ncbi:MAG TPA: IS1595 family transposase [Xanthobacteraceae bacterium]|nr:IS1595 family transposase [Xanthobacteraceae bacterium]
MANRPKPVPQMTTRQFEDRFPIGDDEACLRYLVARRWPGGVHCPRCGNTDLYDASSYKPFHWQCRECDKNGYRFSAIAGTIFENTKKPLRDWFRVTHLMLASKKGMSALQIQRMMGFGSYETAHSMCHKIRAALISPEAKLGGIVEIDETWIGGKNRNRHWNKKRRKDDKTPIIGAVERQGNVVARVLRSVTGIDAARFVSEVVSDKVSLLATDAWRGYEGLDAVYPRAAVDHHKKQYVIGAVHTNTIEGFWSIFKRGVVGTFHKMSAKYMPLYVAEFQFRYNNRSNPDMFGTAIAGC